VIGTPPPATFHPASLSSALSPNDPLIAKAEFPASLRDPRKRKPMTKVLIVDDHAFIRRGIQFILQVSPEWDVCGEGDTGAAAVRLARELQPDILIMDVSMPEMNGIEATRVIHQADPQIKILLLTLHESAELVRSAFRAGALGYLLKAEAEQELLRALDIVSGGGTYISPKLDPQVAKTAVNEFPGSR